MMQQYPNERRAYQRTQVRMGIQIMRMDPSSGDILDQVDMVDISRGGIGIVSSKAYYPGQRLVMKLPAAGMDVRNICGVIRRCEKRSGRYHVGIQFDHPIASLCADRKNASPAAAAA